MNNRARILSWGLGLLIATPVLARQWTDPAAKPVPQPVAPQAHGGPVLPAVGSTPPVANNQITPASAVNGQSSFRPVPAPVGNPLSVPASAIDGVGAAPARFPAPADVAMPAPKNTPVRNGPQPVAPAVIVEKRCPETVNVGTTLTYEVVVRNVGTTAVANVRVEDELPAGSKYLGGDPPADPMPDRLAWSLGVLEPGMERKIKVELQPSAEGELRSTAQVSFSTTTAMRTQVVCPRLVVGMAGPDTALTGDAVPFQIQVSNPGTGPVTNLVVRVKLPATLQHPNGNHIEAEMGSLPAGETRLVPLRTTAGPGGLVTAEVSATGDAVADASAKVDVNVLQPQLQIKRNGPSRVLYKGEVTEEFEVGNPGTAPAGNVMIVEMLPAGIEFLAASDGGTFDAAAKTVTWKLGHAPAGAQRTIALKTRAMVVGEHTTRIAAAGDRGLEARAEGLIAVEGIPALALEVVDLEDPVEVNGELTYEVRVFNQGSCACTNIQIQAPAPEGLTPGEGTGPTACRISGQQMVFEPLPKLATKADAVFRIKVRGTAPNDYRFKVSMTCDQLRSPVNKEEASRVYKN